MQTCWAALSGRTIAMRPLTRDSLPHLVRCGYEAVRLSISTAGARIARRLVGHRLGPGCEFYGAPILRRLPGTRITVGARCRFRSAVWSNLAGINRPCVLATVGEGARLEIGDDCGFSGTVIGAGESVTIGARVMAGVNTMISDTDWHPVDCRRSRGRRRRRHRAGRRSATTSGSAPTCWCSRARASAPARPSRRAASSPARSRPACWRAAYRRGSCARCHRLAMLSVLALALLPPCDFTIREKDDWRHVNDADKTVICVAAAPTYSYEDVGVVQLSASGTADKPRWLRWANDDPSVHPALVPAASTAAISQFDVTGSHWIIDRLVVRDAIYQPRVMGTGNLLQRMVFEKPRPWSGRPVGLMLAFWTGDGNAVVDSVFREPYRAKGIDSYAIYIHQAGRITIQGNEFIDLVDGVSNGPEAGGGNRIVGNEFYQTSASYTDCHGHFDPHGKCSCAEGMAVVPKGPADQAESYIERNLVWGFRKSDPECGGSGTPGVAFDFGSEAGSPLRPMLTRHFTVRDNVIIAQVPNAIYLGRKVEDISFVNNYISGADHGISNSYGQRIRITANTFFANGIDYDTGPAAWDTVYEANRRAGDGELCVTTRHLTSPVPLCVPF